MTRCADTAPKSRAPDGWSVEAMRDHPTYRHYLAPGARCELPAAHDGPHRNGGLVWHNPPVLFVGGKPA